MKEKDLFDVLIYAPGEPGRKVTAKGSTTIADLVRDNGIDVDLLIFGEDEDDDDGDADIGVEPLDRTKSIADLAKGRVVSFHCHRCRQVAVTVNYQKETLRRKFPPSTRARKVLRWAKRRLHLTDADADNLALFLCDSGVQIRETTHLSELVAGGDCAVCFNLSKDRNIEGAA